MISRLKYCAVALAITIAAYFLYALIAVPFIEPSAKLRKSKSTAARPASRTRKLDHLFPAGSWELDQPKVIETDQGTLLFDDYKPLADGRMELTRCSVICYADQATSSKSAGEGGNQGRREVVLRAPHGATLTFDRTLNIIRGEFGRLVGGRLAGEITITSPPSGPGHDDALEIVTRNVQLDAQRIWTPHEVRFRYGPNVGTGRDLTIYLSGASKSTDGEPSLGVGGVKLLELIHLEKLQLQLNDSGLFGAASDKPSPRKTAKNVPDASGANSSVEITCRGPLRFDFEQQLISLEDHVDLKRHHTNGPSDQLLCQLLEIYFKTSDQRPAGDVAPVATADTKKSTKLTPTKVIASGYPVIIRASSAGIGTRAERVEYDCILRRIWLKDRDKVMFNNREHEVEAKELVYSLADNGRLGDLGAVGPGILRGSAGTPPRNIEVTWQDKVVIRRVESRPVLSFTSHVRIALAGSGTFIADTLHLYLNETTEGNGSKKVLMEPDRLHAIGTVTVETASLNAHVDEAKIWFRFPQKNAATRATPRAPTESQAGKRPGGSINPSLLLGESDVPSDKVRRKFDLKARLIEALVIMHDQPVADRVVIKGKLELREITTGEAQPLVIRGDLFELQEGSSAHPRGALLGQPAEVLARGMFVHGDRFHIYPADNLLDIVGSGDMIFPSKRSNKPGEIASQSRAAQVAKVNWKKQMRFDGETAKFEGDVSANLTRETRDGETRGVALGDVLRAQLSRRIDFLHPSEANSVDLTEFAFEGWGFFEVEMFDLAGERKLLEQMQVRQLTINHVSGEIRGEGPGWLRGVHRGRDVLSQQARNTELPQSRSGLNFLRVDFAQTLAGNLIDRQLEFLNGTKTLYGPVDSWNDALDQIAERDLPPQAVVLTCQRLAVAQMGGEEINTDNIELEATGNAYVHNNSFSASGGRISYARAKDQLILEGDGRNPATLAFQKQLGAPPTNITADKILYWPSTRQFELDNFRNSEIFDLGQLRGLGAPNTRPR